MAGNFPDAPLTLFQPTHVPAPCLVEVLDICAPVPLCIGREAECWRAFDCTAHSCVPYRIPPPDPVPVPLPGSGLLMIAALAVVILKRRIRMFKLLTNTIEGVTQVAIGTAKLVAAPVTNLANLEDDHIGDAADTINKGLKKIGKDDDK